MLKSIDKVEARDLLDDFQRTNAAAVKSSWVATRLVRDEARTVGGQTITRGT
jgi:hypothetical protein